MRAEPRLESPHAGASGPSMYIPLVATAAVLLPQSGNVLLWAADRGDVFDKYDDHTNRTVTALYDRARAFVSDATLAETTHNMFCPGLSLNANGHPIVSGGKTSTETSIYDETTSIWKRGGRMNICRGYHSHVTLEDGCIFTIGGSWSGGIGQKSGEIYERIYDDDDDQAWAWRGLPNCSSEPMLTADDGGLFFADNHAWLFAWKERSVFQASPSTAMNWYGTRGDGEHTPAGSRGTDKDSMNGNAVMYDAEPSTTRSFPALKALLWMQHNST